MKEEDKAFVKGLVKARANCRNVADVLTERTGVNYNAQDIRNLITKIDKDEKTAASVEKILGDIKDNGGDVRYRKEENTNNVEVLWVQTKEMRSQLAQSKPLVFECDTTFGTQSFISLSSTVTSQPSGRCLGCYSLPLRQRRKLKLG